MTRPDALDVDVADRRHFLKKLGLGSVVSGIVLPSTGLLALGCNDTPAAAAPVAGAAGEPAAPPPVKVTTKRVAADPTKLPPPIHRSTAIRQEVVLEVQEHVAEIEPGVTFNYMTFGGQVPGPMIRVRQGDRVRVVLRNPKTNTMPHSVDLHAVYGPGGGASATLTIPGQEKSFEFTAMYPGAFIYHCAVPDLDYHISSGMYGMIVVEPHEGLPRVDRELYLGQNEVYTDKPAGTPGHHAFDLQAMLREDPSYVLLNGERAALSPSRWGSIAAKVGERVRIFFVSGGPNLASHFHAVGNVFTKAWADGAVASTPARYVQTQQVSPGSCAVLEMELPVPGEVKLVDHALTRVVHKGMLGVIDVKGPPNRAVFDPGQAAVA